MGYTEKLKDPRWQRKRLEILQRDNFSCTCCGDNKSTLHVHHVKYNGEPWEVDSSLLITLCSECHLIHEFYKGDIIRFAKKLEHPCGTLLVIHMDLFFVLALVADGQVIESMPLMSGMSQLICGEFIKWDCNG